MFSTKVNMLHYIIFVCYSFAAKGSSLKPTPLILNAEGRTVDQSGKEVQLIQRMPTLKANIRAQKKEQFVKLTHEKQTTSTAEAKFQDTRLDIKAPIRTRRAFHFHEKGTFETIGQKIRTKATLDLLQKEIAQQAKKTGISSAARLALLSSIVPKKQAVSLHYLLLIGPNNKVLFLY